MVKPLPHTASIDTWLTHLEKTRKNQDLSILHAAIDIAKSKDPELLNEGVALADILLQLKMDTESLAAAILYPFYKNHDIHIDMIAEEFGEPIRKLISNAVQMRLLSKFQYQSEQDHHQLENLRKMLLAMVTDIRAVIIILAEKVVRLRSVKNDTPENQHKLANICLSIYSPLANRLGIWQIKWEIEDLCLRYIEPEIYKNIARSLESKRAEREAYIEETIHTLDQLLRQHQLDDIQVNGRVKHIYSIYNKMKRKNAEFNQIYDISAFRVLVPTINDCYKALSILQNKWDQILEEFDDYIAQPKPNGYQSIHTVLMGPKNRIIEVQIRTHEMHHTSETGIASHWQYKEGSKNKPVYEEKIALLRQVIAWENEVLNKAGATENQPVNDLFADRVYVFTPAGDIVDLPQGATPIDFAYHIHSEVGHRCRGAKINGKIVPLTYQLQTGERVEILTAKQAHPSRDWLISHLGYIKSSKARHHINHWFRLQEPASIKEETVKLEPIKRPAKSVRKKKIKETEAIDSLEKTLKKTTLLTKIAACCNPQAGDDIIGYITKKNLISIHKKNCSNINYLKKSFSERFIDINQQY